MEMQRQRSSPCPGGAPTELQLARVLSEAAQHWGWGWEGPQKSLEEESGSQMGDKRGKGRRGSARAEAGGQEASRHLLLLASCVCVCLCLCGHVLVRMCVLREGRCVCLTGTHNNSNKSATAPLLCHAILALYLGHLTELSQYGYGADIIPNFQRSKLRCRGAR